MAEKVDPYDVESLSDAVNDSAGRVSTIWISFLIFALYLLTAAATVTDRQLFLAEPVKLPVLNIELPLWGFFFLAPILFVIFHIYVVLQVILLSRTAAAYNDAVRRAVQRENLTVADDASVRQRLANTLFAQIFAGSPRERGGSLGWLLKAMARLTLVVAPILILLTFQFVFLPYHSHVATWTHRLLIAVELIVAFTLWPLVLDPRQDFELGVLWIQLKRAIALPLHLMGPKERRYEEWTWLKGHRVQLAWCVLYVLVCWSLATFPGEPHVNVFTGHWPSSIQCTRWVQQRVAFADLRFDRIVVPHIDAIDHQQLEQIEKATKAAGEKPYEGERTRSMRDRELNCGDFSDFSDLRGIDWTGARLRNADFFDAKLQGATLANTDLEGAELGAAQLQGADLESARLQGASLLGARLQGARLAFALLRGANLYAARLQGANLGSAQLQGAHLESVYLQGANLNSAQLQGADLESAQLQGADDLKFAQLQGADLGGARLQGADLSNARLQGANLDSAQLQGADLESAQLQGADLSSADLYLSILSDVWTWRAKLDPACKGRITDRKSDTQVAVGYFPGGKEQLLATADAETFIELSVVDIPDGKLKDEATARMHKGLDVDQAHDDTDVIAKQWSDCENSPISTMSQDKFDQEHAAFLRNLVCDATREDSDDAERYGIVRIWTEQGALGSSYAAQLARSLLGEDGTACAAEKNFDEATIKILRAAASAPPAPTPAGPAPAPASPPVTPPGSTPVSTK